jgi:hypothetical protein
MQVAAIMSTLAEGRPAQARKLPCGTPMPRWIASARAMAARAMAARTMAARTMAALAMPTKALPLHRRATVLGADSMRPSRPSPRLFPELGQSMNGPACKGSLRFLGFPCRCGCPNRGASLPGAYTWVSTDRQNSSRSLRGACAHESGGGPRTRWQESSPCRLQNREHCTPLLVSAPKAARVPGHFLIRSSLRSRGRGA